MSLLDVAHLRKSYNGTVAVDDVSFQVSAGEVFGLLGPNGAGKTTTMMMLAGLLRADSGSIQIDGQPLDSRSRLLRTDLGVVPQELAIYPDLTARENLHFFGRLYGLRGRELKRQIEIALERTGLRGRASSRVKTFSGGMKRRLNFGIAMLHQPRLLILDEPTVGVDPQSRSHLLECVRQLSQDGMAVLYASHYMEEVEAICRRVAILDHGRMLACDTLQILLAWVRSDLCLRVSGTSDSIRATGRLAERLRGLAQVEQVSADEATITLLCDRQEHGAALNRPLARLLEIINACGADVVAVNTQEPNLEQLFLKLTGHRLRD